MVKYSIFTEFNCNEKIKIKNIEDILLLKSGLREAGFNIIEKESVDNSIVVEYTGSIKDLREEVCEIKDKIRQSPYPIYIAIDANEMYAYKK